MFRPACGIPYRPLREKKMRRYSEVRGITLMCGGFFLGDSKAHTFSLSSQRPTAVPLGPKSFLKNEDTTFGCDIDQIHTSILRCKVDRGNLMIALRHIYTRILPLKVVARIPSGSGNSVLWHILDSKKVCTYWTLVVDVGPDRTRRSPVLLPSLPRSTKLHSRNGLPYS